MLRNYFIIAARHLTRHKLFSSINILCLSIGITFCLLIGVYVLNEKNVNSTIKDADNQYVIKSRWKKENLGLDITSIAPLAKAMKQAYPGLVDGYYRFNPVTNIVSAGDKHFQEEISIGDTTLVSLYGFPLLYGDEKKAFKDNSSAVITEQLAQKLFGRTDVINETITINTTTGTKQDYAVSAVLKKLPYNSVTNFIKGEGYSIFLPSEGSLYFQSTDNMESWDNTFIINLIKLKPGVTPESMKKPFEQVIASHASEIIKSNIQVELAPIKKYYLADNNGAVQKMINTLSFTAAFILLMAIINFVNINIGTSSYRLKEIGLRKVFGGVRKQLIIQYITESLVLTFAAAMLSLLLYELLLPVFNQVMNTQLTSFWNFDVTKILYLLGLVVGVGFISGIYPALVLSSSNTINAIKGKMDSAKAGLVLRKGLLIVQFTLAIVVFINALNIAQQVKYCFTKDLGYNKDQVLVVSAMPKQWDSTGVLKMEMIRNEFIKNAAVKTASLSFEVPDRKPPNSYDFRVEGSPNAAAIQIPTMSADENYASAFQLTIKEGNFFTAKTGYVPAQIVLNESAVKALGMTYPVVGKRITIPSAGATVIVAGVIKDYNYSTLQEQVGPVAYVQVKDVNNYRYISVKLAGNDVSNSMAQLKNKWQQMSPGTPFEYFFMDEKFQSLYQSELQLQKASGIATWLTMVIVFMGIFGVVAFTLTKRIKEIAMRKVLGADARKIITLFIKDYALLILIANIIAWPLAFSITNKWLQNYAYRIEQSWTTFAFVGAVSFATAFILIAVQCYKVAMENPMKSLRTE